MCERAISYPKISVIIPTLNEEKKLPELLQSLKIQSRLPDEIIIVDAGSTDSTLEIAKKFGVKICNSGGFPGRGRNEEAKLASGSVLIFLDADVLLDRKTIDEMLKVKAEKFASALSYWTLPFNENSLIEAGYVIVNRIYQVLNYLEWFHGHGSCLLVDREVHEKIGGFDCNIILAEDEDYINRLARIGTYHFSKTPIIRVSARRVKKYGVVKTLLIYSVIGLHRFFVGEVTRNLFRYFESETVLFGD